MIFVTHDIDEAITMGDRIAILRAGGVLAQYDTPDAILAHPADDFVAQFIGEDRALRRLALRRLAEIELDPVPNPNPPTVQAAASTTVRNAISLLLESGDDRLLVVGDDGRDLGVLTLARAAELLDVIAAGPGPVIPNFGQGSSCVTGDNLFCWDWVKEHWGDTLQPALVLHIELTAVAVAIGSVARLRPGAPRAPPPPAEQPISIVSALVYTFPSIALFQLLVPFTGLTFTTAAIPLVALHARDPVPELPRRSRRGAARRCSRRRAGWA